MNESHYTAEASDYLARLCGVVPNRRTGSKGNQQATAFFAETISRFDYAVDTHPFDCLDYESEAPLLTHEDDSFAVFTSPYSTACETSAELVSVSTVNDLETVSCRDRILLLKGELCEEQLMPRNFVFYNPEHHKKIYALLEAKAPAAIITATAKKPDQVGALYPFPLIVDGDFDIPSVYCTDRVGTEIAKRTEGRFTLSIRAKRIPSSACNVIARKNANAPKKIGVTAHIDAYEDTPGASDNASGTVVLLLLAEMLRDYRASCGLEIMALNGEDHYSAGGQMDYLRRFGSDIGNVLWVANIDDVGYKNGRTSWSHYGVDEQMQKNMRSVFNSRQGLVEGEPWFNGDHMIFVQKGCPALAFTSEKMPELMATITHTARDTPENIDTAKLVELAEALKELIHRTS